MLITYFNRLLPLSEEEKALVLTLFTTRTYRKRYFVLQEGDVAMHFRKLSERNQQVLQSRILEMLSGSAQDCYTSFAERQFDVR